MIQTLNNKQDGVLVFDDCTGEVFYHHPAKKKRLGRFNKYIGMDTKYPSECITKDSLLESLCVIDAYIGTTTRIASDMLVESVSQGLLTPQQLKLVKHIANNLTGWNMYIGSTKDLYSCGIDERNLKRVVDDLSPNIIKVVSRNKPFRGDIVIQINPFYAWKGDNEYRSNNLEFWYPKPTPHLCGVDNPQTLVN